MATIHAVEVKEFAGLRIGEVDCAEAVGRAWQALELPLDVVRVPSPPPDSWPALRRAGFICKPNRISWYADASAFRSRMSKNDRQNLRTAEARAVREGLTFELVQPLTEALLDEFLRLYESRVEEMRRGLNVARAQRAQTLAGQRFSVLAARDPSGALAGATVCEESAVDSSLRIRFSAVSAPWRAKSLARVMYVRAADCARELGYPTVT